jgi:hypothetical protein
MRWSVRLGVIPALLLVMAALAAAPAWAAKMPNGSYRQTCSNIKVKDASSKKPWLVADCRDYKGRYRSTRLRYKQCRADIANINGQLSCWSGGTPPHGSWSQSCRDGYVQNGVLYADCQRRNGNWWRASITVNHCRRGIANIDGQLRCE